MDLLSVGIVITNKQISGEAQAGLLQLPVRIVFDQREIGEWAPFLEKLEQVRPDVLIVELSQLADPLEDVIRQVKSTSGHPQVIVVHPSADSDTLLRAIRANADEYLFPPLGEDLTRAIHKISEERLRNRAGTKPRGKVFGVFGAKGGCGATTVSCHLATQLAQEGPMGVLLADFDLDSGIVGFLMQSQCRYSVLDAVDNIHRLDLSFWKALVSNGRPGLEVIMAPPHPGMQRERRVDDFRHILRFVRSNYDWTVVDLGRGLTPMSMTMLEEVDEAFLVTTPDIPALHQTKNIILVLRDLGYGQQRLRLLLNRMPRRHEISVGELETMLGLPVYAVLPKDEEALTEAFADRKLASPDSDFSKSMVQLAGKISGLQTRKAKGKFFSLLHT